MSMTRPDHILLSITLLSLASVQVATSQTRVIVEGSVQDPYGAVIMGATVTVQKTRSIDKKDVQKTVSDSKGAFRFDLTQPGYYNLHATADGYVEPSFLEGYRGLVNVAEANGGSQPRVRRVKLLLYRQAAVRGRLLEIVNGLKKPVVKQPMQLVFTRYREGRLTLAPTDQSGVTDSNGTFALEKLPPGDYFVQISPTVSESARARPAAKPKQSDRPHGYRRTYWPEDAESGYARPFRVDSGADVDLGDIVVKRGPFFRISGDIEYSKCSDGEKVGVTLGQELGQAHIGRATVSLPCTIPFLFNNVSPGTYELRSWIQGRPLLERENVRIPIVVTDEDVNLSLQAVRPLFLRGKIKLPESLPREQKADFRVVLFPVGRMPFFDEGTSTPTDAEGRFTATTSQPGEIEVKLQGLKEPHYLKQVSYNGVDLPGAIVTIDPHAIVQSIEATVSDRPCTLEGAATVKGDAAPGTRVLVSRWPFVLKNGYPVFITCRSDEMGHYKQSSLSPGVYRVAAVTNSALRRIERREDAMQVLSAGKEVELAEGTTRTLDIEISAW